MAHGDWMRTTKRTRKVVGVAAAIALSGLVTAGCTSVKASAKPWGPDRETMISPQTAPTTTTTTTTTSADDPIDGGQPISDVTSCRTLAKGPWQTIPYGADPVATVLAGKIPPFVSGADGTPLKITEFPTVDDYNDHVTLADPIKVYEAFTAAGYEEGIEASYVKGAADTTVTVVRFRNAAAAKTALSAHLSDYCQTAIGGKSNAQSNGLIILRESKAVVTTFVMGDAEISVLVCECYGDTDADRERYVEEWADEIKAILAEPPPAQKPV